MVAEAEQKGEKVHIGRIFEICTLKGSELPEGDPNRKYKGRASFQGNNVFDESSDYICNFCRNVFVARIYGGCQNP